MSDDKPSPAGLVATAIMAVRALLNPTVMGASVIAQDSQGRVLLVRHSYLATWHLPGGGVDRGEPPERAAIRELEEEAGLVESAPPEFLGLYTRPVGWFTNVIALYRVRNVRVEFKPNMEVREILFCDPQSPPADTSQAVKRRLAELVGKTPRSAYW